MSFTFATTCNNHFGRTPTRCESPDTTGPGPGVGVGSGLGSGLRPGLLSTHLSLMRWGRSMWGSLKSRSIWGFLKSQLAKTETQRCSEANQNHCGFLAATQLCKCKRLP